MKIRMIASMAGTDFALSPGEETDRFPRKEALRLIEAGYAVPSTASGAQTAAKVPAAEKRARKKA